MDQSRKDKLRIVAIAVVAVLVVLTLFVFAIPIFLRGRFFEGTIAGITALLLIGVAATFLKRKYEEAKKGIPIQDERTKRVLAYAAYRAYLISIYWLLAISFAVDYGVVEFRDIQQAIGTAILGMTIILGLCYLWVNRAGEKLEC